MLRIAITTFASLALAVFVGAAAPGPSKSSDLRAAASGPGAVVESVVVDLNADADTWRIDLPDWGADRLLVELAIQADTAIVGANPPTSARLACLANAVVVDDGQSGGGHGVFSSAGGVLPVPTSGVRLEPASVASVEILAPAGEADLLIRLENAVGIVYSSLPVQGTWTLTATVSPVEG